MFLEQLPDEQFMEIALYSVFEGLEVDIKRPAKKQEHRKTQELTKVDLDLDLDGLSLEAIEKLLKSVEGGNPFNEPKLKAMSMF